MKNNENKKRDCITSIIDSDITEKLLVEKASEHDNLRFAYINSGVTTASDTNETNWDYEKESNIKENKRPEESVHYLRRWGGVPAKSEELALTQ